MLGPFWFALRHMRNCDMQCGLVAQRPHSQRPAPRSDFTSVNCHVASLREVDTLAQAIVLVTAMGLDVRTE